MDDNVNLDSPKSISSPGSTKEHHIYSHGNIQSDPFLTPPSTYTQTPT